jgi:hypothetical protein
MNAKIWMVNLALAALLVFAGSRIVQILHEHPQTPAGIRSSEVEGHAPQKKEDRNNLEQQRAYELIVTQSLFSPERKEYTPQPEPEEEEEADDSPRLLGSRITLYGVVMTDGEKKALINNPNGRLGDGKYAWIEEGQQVGNLEVIAIQPDEIHLNDGNTRHQVTLMKKRSPGKRRGSERESQPTVVSSGAAQKGKGLAAKTVSSSGDSEEADSASREKPSESKEVKYKWIDSPFGKRRVRVE